MTLDTRHLDAWLTRGPPEYEPPPPLKCAMCGCFLVREPYGRREWVSISHCHGKAKVITHTYDAEGDAAILAIIGDDYVGTDYDFALPPECGGKGKPERRADYDGDIDPKEAHEYEHASHFFEDDPMSPYVAEVRVCGHCGHYNEEPSW